jgi:hypothetical protein
MKADTPGQAIARPRVVEGEIVSADVFNTQVAKWRAEGFNVLTPTVSLSTIPQDHVIVVNRVQINPIPEAGDVYFNPLFCKQGEVALSKAGLEKIAQCAGINIVKSERTDSRTVEHVYSYHVEGWWLGFDGTRLDRVANKSIDLRDGAGDIKGMGPAQVTQARRHGEAICETKAQNRLYRQYGLKQKYAQQELDRPFVVLKLRYQPDMSNPIVAAIVTQLKMGATTLMFPQAVDLSTVNPLQLPEHARPKGTPIDVSDDNDDPAPVVGTQGAPAAVEDFDPSDPPPEDDDWITVTVTHVGQNPARDQFYVTLDDGRKLHTTDLSVAKACSAAMRAKTPIKVRLGAKKGEYLDLVEIGGGSY